MELPEATIVRLKSQHQLIEELLSKLTAEQFDQEVFPGKWTVRQQLAPWSDTRKCFLSGSKRL